MDDLITIGKSELRKDAWGKVNGKAKYVADISLKDMSYGVILRSPYPHARIVEISTEKARQMKDVQAVITAEDIPGDKTFGPLISDRPPLAFDKVRFVGEPIAIIVARSRHAAEQAREEIKVKYEELPAVFDPIRALSSSAPAIHENGNQLAHFEISDGDIEIGFSEADIILEETFSVPRIYPAYLENEASVAQWRPGDELTIWASTQQPFQDHLFISKVLGISKEKINVKVETIGGAFGGKEDPSLQILAGLAAWKIRGAVKLVNSREESMLAHPKRHAAILDYKVGIKKDGTLVALQSEVHVDTGAYASYGPAVAQLLTETAPGPYRIPHIKVDTYVVYTNGPIAGAMRGFGAPQTNFCYESLMDILAAKLGINPIEIRRKNIWRAGDKSYTRVRINQAESIGMSLELAADEVKRLKMIPASAGKISGVGLALAMQSMGLGRGVPDDSANRLEWLPDGRVALHLGAPDLGQGLMTVGTQIAAEALGLEYSQIEIVNIDTAHTPDGGVSCASRMTYIVGNSIQIAAKKIINLLIDEAAQILKTSKTNLSYKRGKIYRSDQPTAPPIPVSEITSRLAENGQSVIATGIFSFPYGPDTPDHLPVGMPHVLFSFGAQVARVETDPELGVIQVKEVVAIHDLGKIINQAGAEGQIEGGVAMGIGYALSEEMVLKSDQQWVKGFTEYLLPTTLDVPPTIKSILLEVPEESGPHGAKGIGEITLVPTAAAIANAVYDGTGVRVTSIPIKPDTIIKSRNLK